MMMMIQETYYSILGPMQHFMCVEIFYKYLTRGIFTSSGDSDRNKIFSITLIFVIETKKVLFDSDFSPYITDTIYIYF